MQKAHTINWGVGFLCDIIIDFSTIFLCIINTKYVIIGE